MADDKKEKKTLIVISVGTQRTYQDNPVVQFKAKEKGTEAEAVYETWGTELVGQVVKDAELNTEITYKETKDGPVNRVTQMYDSQAKAIRQPQRRTSGSYGKSPEETAIERASIEGQTSYNGIIELLKTQVITLEHWQAVTALEYAEMKMRKSMSAAPVPKATTLSPAKEEKATTAPAAPKEPDKPITEETLQQLVNIVKERDYDISYIQAYIVRKYSVSSSKDLSEKQAKELQLYLQKAEGIPKTKETPPLFEEG